jgi:hypothetical protein
MTKASIRIAKQEAIKFIDRCKIVLEEESDDLSSDYSKNTSALRRQSMELTRALSEMRK